MTDKITIERETLIDLIAQHLCDTYYCKRVWAAWQVGTMSEDDFEPVEGSDTPGEIADAILAALAAQPAEPVALGDALRWSKATESHGAYVFTPAQLRVFYEYATRAAPAAVPLTKEQRELFDLILHHYGPDKRLQPLRDLIAAAGDKT